MTDAEKQKKIGPNYYFSKIMINAAHKLSVNQLIDRLWFDRLIVQTFGTLIKNFYVLFFADDLYVFSYS